jgi:hypothetical protein
MIYDVPGRIHKVMFQLRSGSIFRMGNSSKNGCLPKPPDDIGICFFSQALFCFLGMIDYYSKYGKAVPFRSLYGEQCMVYRAEPRP